MDRPWGRWTRLHMDDQCELRKLEVLPGGYCTRHFHREQTNVIFVLQGELEVSFFDEADDGAVKYASETLSPEMPLTDIPPLKVHQFKARMHVVAYELNIATGPNPVDPSDSVQLGPAGRDTP